MGLRRACLPPLPLPPASRYGLASLRRSGLTRLPPLRAREHPSPRDALPPAPPAGIMPKPHERQQFSRPCALFSPARVDNSLQQALTPARSYTPWSAQAAVWGRPRLALPAAGKALVARRSGSRPSGVPEIPSRASGTALRRQGRSVARAKGPTPPSSTAAPSHTPPRRCLRGVQATPGSRTSGRKGTPVSAAARGPVSAAADTASPLDCPRALLGCQATFLPPVGSATRSNSRYALPHRSAPQGAQ
jgi:hypothetical protein